MCNRGDVMRQVAFALGLDWKTCLWDVGRALMVSFQKIG